MILPRAWRTAANLVVEFTPRFAGGGTFGASPSEGLLRFRKGRKRLKNRGRSRKPGRRLRSLRSRF
jgi:hypothetical protein